MSDAPQTATLLWLPGFFYDLEIDAPGTGGDDDLTGSVLLPMEGDDTLTGTGSDDIALLFGNSDGWTFGHDGTQLWVQDTARGDGDMGTETLNDIEALRFTDGVQAVLTPFGDGVAWVLTQHAWARDGFEVLTRETHVGTVLLDTADSYAWDRQVLRYTDGQLVQRVVTEDDGDTVTTDYHPNGQIAQTQFVDGSDSRAFASVTETFDDSGSRLSREVVQDNGDVVLARFSGGVQVETSLTDGSDSHAWQSLTTSFAADGRLSSRVILQDDGEQRTQTYDASGALTEMRCDDLSDLEAWDSLVFHYADGQLAQTVLTYDDSGDTVTVDYLDGQRSQTTYTDGDGDLPWVSRIDSYTADGVTLEDRTFVYADGSETVILF